ncbi:MAG: hypothetical protein R8P61_28865 [Bacteroidia bacterium]|nr:hypothetical protein [Bacteroidia bacterium]
MNWNISQKIAFRFFAVYIFLFTMSNQFVASGIFDKLWRIVVPWFAKNILKLEKDITVFTNGSGDTTYNFVSLLVFVLIAAIVTVIWTAINPQKPKDSKLLDPLVVLVRYYVIFQMVTYGLAKLFYLQFQEPMISRLIQPYGESSPMGLLWTFMGFSKGYTILAGAAEFLGGILLLFRKTRTLGAMVVFGVMLNVMAMNFFYDVPVKILSSHLVFLSAFLLVLDGKRLLNFLILNKEVPAREIQHFITNPKIRRIKDYIKWGLISIGLGFSFYQMTNFVKQFGQAAEKPPLYGLHEVESFERNGEIIPPLTTDSTRWDKLIVQRAGSARVHFMPNNRKFYDFKPDSLENFVLINISGDTTAMIDTLFFSQPDSSLLELEGIVASDTLKIRLKSRQKNSFLLMNRGFHWVSEYPHNR